MAPAATDGPYCLMGQPFETYQQHWRISKNRLGNVFVWLEPPNPQTTIFRPPASLLPKEDTVTIHQPHCAFLPHCSVLRSLTPDGSKLQTLTVVNDARVLHNSKVVGSLFGEKNTSINPWDGKGSPAYEKFALMPEKTPITVSCGVHGWMNAYVRVFDHPFATITSVGDNHQADPKKRVWENPDDPNYGTFKIEGLPVGTPLKLFVWHEKAGFLNKNGKTGEDITIDADPSKNKLTFTAKE
jgi:hypothetical protein